MNRINTITSTLAQPTSNRVMPVVAGGLTFCSNSTGNNRTPMSTLTPTPMIPFTASHISHSTYVWLCEPVAIAGHVNRSLSFGTGFFKLQLQNVVSWLFLLLLVGNWSCNLKKILHTINMVIDSKNPDDGVASPLHWQHRHIQQRTAAAYRPVASAGYCCRLHPLESALLNRLSVLSAYLKEIPESRPGVTYGWRLKNPDDGVASPLHWQHRHIQQRTAAAYHPVASAG